MAHTWHLERRWLNAELFDIENNFTKLEQVLCASLAGVVERVNKLISVTPVKTRFFVSYFESLFSHQTFKVQWWNWRCSCGKGGWGATKEMEGGYPISSGWRTSSFLGLELIPFCFLTSYCHLSVNLPGGELRRRGAEDELSMRKYLQVAGVDCNLQFAQSVTLYSKCG